MKVRLESTTKVVTVDGVEARVWEGETDSGIPIAALITRIAVEEGQPQGQFLAELAQCRPPTAGSPAAEAWPMRMLR
jgi:hypothetical protein